ncbi:LysM domain-containing protein [Seiridium cupressi]
MGVLNNRLLATLILGVAVAQDACPGGPTFSDTVSDCNAWHTVVDGDSCYSIEQEYGITADDFLSWNPSVSSDCLTNFWLEEAYCVGVGTSTCSTAVVSSASSTSSTISSTITSSATSGSIITSSNSGSIGTVSVTQNTTYSTRYSVTSHDITTTAVETAWPPSRTKAGQPSYCRTWHLVNQGDTCQSIVNQYGVEVTLSDFLEWNPTIGSDCSGLYVSWWVCVGIQSQTSVTLTWSTSATNATVPASTAYTSPASTSVDFAFTADPVQTGIPSSCQSYYLAVTDDTCDTVLSLVSYITEDQFFEWNPALNGDCQGMWVGYYYCIANFDSGAVPMPTVTTKPSAAAPSITASCTSWYNATVGDTCDRIALQFGTFSEDDFIGWNPDVWSTCDNLQMGLYYCVAVSGTPTTRTVPYSATTTAASSATLSADCTDIWYVGTDDTCASIAETYSMSLSDFIAMNSQLSATTSQCYLTSDTYVCVGTDSGNSTTELFSTTITTGVTSTSGTATTTSATTTTTGGTSTAVSTPLPTQSGMVSGCVRFYYVETGDGCYDIATAAGISLDTFLEWNPSAESDCSGLWSETYCCIGISGAATTITSGTAVPAPTS